jgi:hypothetical protein
MYQLVPNVGRRQAQNRLYMSMVTAGIHDRYEGDPRLSYLVPDPESWSGVKVSVLAELGRLRPLMADGDFWETVEWLLETRPNVKRAVTALRAMRTGDTPEGTTDGLEDAIVAAIVRYLETHRTASVFDVIAALDIVRWRYSEAFSETAE